jgi:uncharacterized protein (DUF305 family)
MDMMREMHREFTVDADVDFARSIVKHHEGGIAKCCSSKARTLSTQDGEEAPQKQSQNR